MRRIGPAISGAGVVLAIAMSACNGRLLSTIGASGSPGASGFNGQLPISETPVASGDVPSDLQPATGSATGSAPAGTPGASPSVDVTPEPEATAGPTPEPTPTPTPIDYSVKEILEIAVWHSGAYVTDDSSWLALDFSGATGSCLQLRGEVTYTDFMKAGVNWETASPSMVMIDQAGRACIAEPPAGDFGLVPITAVATGVGTSTKSFFIRVDATASADFTVD